MSSSARTKTHRARTAWMLPNVALNEAHAAKLRALCAHRNETASAVIRSLIASARITKPLRRTEST